jgi:3-oxoacyl-(acyl-carrier-protein) synthase
VTAGAQWPKAADSRRRVVVTGMGAVTAAGWGVTAFSDAARSGHTVIGPLTRIPHYAQRTHLAGQAPDLGSGTHGIPRWPRRSRADHFALFAALEAIAQAGLPASLESLSASVFFGSSTSGLFESELFYEQLTGRGPDRADRKLLASHQISAPAKWWRRQRVSGPVETTSRPAVSWSGGGQALQSVRRAKSMWPFSACRWSAYHLFRLQRTESVDEQPCRPFRAGRMGMSLGRAALLVLRLSTMRRARATWPKPGRAPKVAYGLRQPWGRHCRRRLGAGRHRS